MECKYISHLDLNRTMLRAVRRAELPIWYTEGFNPHPFVTFPLPISLGISSMRECMDIRIVDDSFDIKRIPDMMNPFLPTGIRVFDATEPVLDPKFISFASYTAEISTVNLSGTELFDSIKGLCNKNELIVQKKSKAGMKDVDMLPYVKSMDFKEISDKSICFNVILPAGNTKNVGLSLVLKAVEIALDTDIDYSIEKLQMFTEEMTPFA